MSISKEHLLSNIKSDSTKGKLIKNILCKKWQYFMSRIATISSIIKTHLKKFPRYHKFIVLFRDRSGTSMTIFSLARSEIIIAFYMRAAGTTDSLIYARRGQRKNNCVHIYFAYQRKGLRDLVIWFLIIFFPSMYLPTWAFNNNRHQRRGEPSCTLIALGAVGKVARRDLSAFEHLCHL